MANSKIIIRRTPIPFLQKAGVKVRVDGQPQPAVQNGQTIEVPVEPGIHTVRFTFSFTDKTTQVNVPEHGSAELIVSMVRTDTEKYLRFGAVAFVLLLLILVLLEIIKGYWVLFFMIFPPFLLNWYYGKDRLRIEQGAVQTQITE